MNSLVPAPGELTMQGIHRGIGKATGGTEEEDGPGVKTDSQIR